MTERNYLLKVVGLTGAPKVLTFGLTLVSFPFLMRSLGSNEYGVYVFAVSILALFEVLVDFGVAPASGKALASVRTHRPEKIRSELITWIKIQTAVSALGAMPLLMIVQLVAATSSSLSGADMLQIMVITMIFSMFINFLRINLNSLLEFKSIAIINTLQSISTSAGYFVVAIWFPSAFYLAAAGLVTVLLVFVVASILLVISVSRVNEAKSIFPQDSEDETAGGIELHATISDRLKESMSFLWLRFSTRFYQEGPLALMGFILAADIVGVVGAFRKISEIISTPYLIIGNALMVRVFEVSKKGTQALLEYWKATIRIGSTSIFFGAIVFLLSDQFSELLLPGDVQSAVYFRLLSPLIVATALFGILAPISDYKGGLTMRNKLLTITATGQMALLWLVGTTAGEHAFVSVMVGVNIALVVGYACISHKVLFESFFPILHSEIFKFATILIAACPIVLMFAKSVSESLLGFQPHDLLASGVLVCICYIVLVASLLRLTKTWQFYFHREFFEFS